MNAPHLLPMENLSAAWDIINFTNDDYDGTLSTGNDSCDYKGTDYLEVKILLIGVFATGLALLSFLFNAFFSLVFALNARLRRSSLYYFGVLALLDLALAINYLALMSVPVYMDQYRLLWLYQLFLAYLRPMLCLSNFAVFASVLMILLATSERLLQTFSGRRVVKARRLLQRHRPRVTLLMMCWSFAYKLCTYFEIEVVENDNCTEFERFEVRSAVEGDEWHVYRFWWMFVFRNVIDHIGPFFLLIILNFFIIRALNREHFRATHSFATAAAAVPLRDNDDPRLRCTATAARDSLRRQKGCGGSGRLQRHALTLAEDNSQKQNLRAATRTLIAVVSMYLMSKVLQVAVTFFETFSTDEMIIAANYGPFRPLYSYVNDTIPILTLLSSTLRFPVYCACNKPILTASKATLRRLFGPEWPPSMSTANNNNCTKTSYCSSSCRSQSPPGKRRVHKFVLPAAVNGRRCNARVQSPRSRSVNSPAAARIAIRGIDEAELVAMMLNTTN
uniref:G-protein coupled receptors family 1 profile domain-containing protein n=1 Tax=Globodera rostochiensis TaxID=31243 RepID=A0A914HF14_GLORO